MSWRLQEQDLKRLFEMWNRDYVVYGPRRMAGEGLESETDVIR